MLEEKLKIKIVLNSINNMDDLVKVFAILFRGLENLDLIINNIDKYDK